MEDHLTTPGGIDNSAWGRSRKKRNIKRKLTRLEDSSRHLISDIPAEIILHIMSFLNLDCVWENLYMNRWSNQSEARSQSSCSQNDQEWKCSYISKHKAMVAALSDCFTGIDGVDGGFEGSSEEVPFYTYLDAIKILTDLEVGFEDACLLFRSKLSVVRNLIGLHYSSVSLQVSPKDLMDALVRHRVWHRQVIVHWCIRYEMFKTMSKPQSYALKLSLAEIANGEEAIFFMLDQGTNYEVRYLTIRPAK